MDANTSVSVLEDEPGPESWASLSMLGGESVVIELPNGLQVQIAAD